MHGKLEFYLVTQILIQKKKNSETSSGHLGYTSYLHPQIVLSTLNHVKSHDYRRKLICLRDFKCTHPKHHSKSLRSYHIYINTPKCIKSHTIVPHKTHTLCSISINKSKPITAKCQPLLGANGLGLHIKLHRRHPCTSPTNLHQPLQMARIRCRVREVSKL